MAIDFQTPTVSPPSATDVVDDNAPAVGTGGLDGQTQDFIGGWLQQPGRYDNETVQQGLDLINANSARAQELGLDALDERMSLRGLVGSDVESRQTRELIAQLNDQRSAQEFALKQDIARTNAQDMSAAAGAALNYGNLALGQGQLGLGYANLFQSGGQFAQELAQRESEFGRSLGISQQDIDLRATELQQQAELEGRSLDIEEARQQAQAEYQSGQLDVAFAELAQSGDQFDRQLALSYTELAETTGLARDQLALQRDEMVNIYGGQLSDGTTVTGDRAEERALRMDLQADSQDFQALQSDLNRQLEREALELQRYGVDAETAWREAALDQEDRLQSRSLDLQQMGLTAEEAYRAAALEVQTELDRERMALQAYQTQMQVYNSYQTAQLGAMSSIIESLNRFAAVNSDQPYGESLISGGGAFDPNTLPGYTLPGQPSSGDGFDVDAMNNWYQYLSQFYNMPVGG